MMRLRFTIRDVLWLTLVVAMGVGWWAYGQRTHPRYEVLEGTNVNHNFSQLFLRDRETGQAWIKDGDSWMPAQWSPSKTHASLLPGRIDAEVVEEAK